MTQKPYELHMSKANEGNFTRSWSHMNLVTRNIHGSIDVLISFWYQKFKGQGHSRSRQRYNCQWKPVEFHLVFCMSCCRRCQQKGDVGVTPTLSVSVANLSVELSKKWSWCNKCISCYLIHSFWHKMHQNAFGHWALTRPTGGAYS